VHFLKFFVDFLSFYNSTLPCIVEFAGYLLSDEILLALAVRKWDERNNQREWELDYAKPGIGNGNEPLGIR